MRTLLRHLGRVVALVFVVALVVVVGRASVSAQDRTPETIPFQPAEPPAWGLRNVGVAANPLRWSHWYGENTTVIDTVPADAQLQLFYIRSNFQKLYMRVEPPVKLILPTRIMATDRDALTVRVTGNGFKSKEWSWNVMDVPKKITLELKPLPNSLVSLIHTHLADRTTLALRTTKEPQFRVIKSPGQSGFTLALSETAKKIDATEGPSGGHVRLIEINQVGEDVLVKVDTDSANVEARSRKSYDPIRKEHVFVLDLMPRSARPPTQAQVRNELDAIDAPAACELAFEASLRGQLQNETVARAHRTSGSFANLYQREAMMRLGRFDHGTVHTVGGESLRTGSPIELQLALQSAVDVKGYLAMLDAFARTQPDPELALRSLVAPELTSEEFNEIYRKARSACAA